MSAPLSDEAIEEAIRRAFGEADWLETQALAAWREGLREETAAPRKRDAGERHFNRAHFYRGRANFLRLAELRFREAIGQPDALERYRSAEAAANARTHAIRVEIDAASPRTKRKRRAA